MGLNVEKGVLTASTTNGNTTTVNLPAGFDLKAIIFWAAYNTAEGDVDGHGILSMGFATNDGGSIQQVYMTHFDTDALGTSNVARGINTTAALKGFSGAVPATVDYELDVTTFAATQFVCTWTDAPASAIQVHYMALGGSDVSAARCGSFVQSTAAATQDVTVDTGFGQPDLLLFGTGIQTALTDARGSAAFGIGVATSATERRASSTYAADNVVNMDVRSWQGARALMTHTAAGAVDSEADLSAKGSWPTDGFQLSYADQAAAAFRVLYLALKGTFTATIGSNTAPTAAAPQVQNLALASGTPKGALLWGTPIPTTAGVTSADASLGGFMVGGTDGTNEGAAGIVQDDGNTTSIAGRWHSESKAIKEYQFNAAPALQSEADSSISGSDLVLTWDDTDSVAREYQYLILGTATAPISVTLTPATTTDVAQALAVKTTVALSPATEAESAQPLVAQIRVALTPTAVESDAAVALTFAQIVALAPVTETDAAQPLAPEQRFTLTPAVEADAVVPLVADTHTALTLVAETDVAVPFSYRQIVSLIPAVEVGTAVELTLRQTVTTTPAAEADEAVALSATTRTTLAPAVESDTATALTRFGPAVTLIPAAETATARALTVTAHAGLTSAVELDEAVALLALRPTRLTIDPAPESDEALPLITPERHRALDIQFALWPCVAGCGGMMYPLAGEPVGIGVGGGPATVPHPTRSGCDRCGFEMEQAIHEPLSVSR